MIYNNDVLYLLWLQLKGLFFPLKDNCKIGILVKRPSIPVKSLHFASLIFAVLLVSTPESWENDRVCFSLPNISKVLLAEQFTVGGVQS